MRDEQTLFRDYPVTFWLMGAAAIVAGMLIRKTVPLRVAFVLLGVAGVGFGSVLTVTFDRRQRMLALRYRSLFRHSMKCYSWADIGSVDVREDVGEGNFRVELSLWSGEVIPLRQWYSPGKAGHQRMARKLESLLTSVPASPTSRATSNPSGR